jgi:hypothetical protein
MLDVDGRYIASLERGAKEDASRLTLTAESILPVVAFHSSLCGATYQPQYFQQHVASILEHQHRICDIMYKIEAIDIHINQ